MPTLNLSLSISGNGGSISRNTPRTADGGGNIEAVIPKGFAGTLSTRTDNDTGTLTLNNGHGITTAAVIDIYWVGGARFGVTVGTVSVNSVPVGADNSGTGSNFPTQGTAIVASIRTAINATVDGDALGALALQQSYASTLITSQSRAVFRDASNAAVASLTLEALTPRLFDIAGGDTNVFTGNPITNLLVSNGSSTTDATFKLLWVQDSTP